MKLKKILGFFGIVLILCLFGATSIARADGGIFYPPDYYTRESSQKAFIYFQNQTEDLVISASYQGNTNDFAWVIPTPSKPEINKSDSKLFTTLQNITKTAESSPTIYENATSTLSKGSKSQPVEVMEQKTIDIYDTAILKATDDKALAKWLADNKYSFPEDKSSLLKEYIEQGWYFTVAKIQNALQGDTNVQTQLKKGTITPLRFSFATNKIIYPMKLTRLAADDSQVDYSKIPSSPEYQADMPITLYVLADRKTTQTSLETQWANWIKADNIKTINSSAGEENWIPSNNKLFLTKMYAAINVGTINSDFTITSAPNNDIFPVPEYKTASFWGLNLVAFLVILLIAVLTPVGLLFIISLLLQIFVKRKWLSILCTIYQILAGIGTITVGLLIFIGAENTTSGSSNPFAQSGFAGAFLGLLLLLIVEIYFIVKMIKRRKVDF